MNNQRLAILTLMISFFICILLLLHFHTKATTKNTLNRFSKKPLEQWKGNASGSSFSHASQSSNSSKNGNAGKISSSRISTSNQEMGISGPGSNDLQGWTSNTMVNSVQFPSNAITEFEAKTAAIQEHRNKVLEASETWLRKKISDQNLDKKTTEIYRLRLLPNMKQGIKMLEKGDFAEALKEFNKALEDPDASPVSKYLIHDYMLQAAAKMKDKMLYIKLLKAQGILQRENDLKVLGLVKSNQAVEYAEYMEKHLKAAQDSAAFDKLVEHTMQAVHASSAERGEIENSVKKRIKEFEAFFDESERKS